MPPSFADQEYWDLRFRKDPCTFDWLLPASVVREVVAGVLEKAPSPRILHIGCGTSELSFHLRFLVPKAGQVCNVDYSPAAVEAGIMAEVDRMVAEGKSHEDRMDWRQVDLLSGTAVEGLMATYKGSGAGEGGPFGPGLFSVIVDKSTSDAISCGEDVKVELPYRFRTETPQGPQDALIRSTASVHPLHVLAIHLAALAVPGEGRWIAISYTDDRFPFFPPFPRSKADGLLDEAITSRRFPHPGVLWRLEDKWKVKIPQEIVGIREGVSGDGDGVKRPEVFHWVHVLGRTDVTLCEGDGAG
jgi:EEF1A lysine methyltransferase 4